MLGFALVACLAAMAAPPGALAQDTGTARLAGLPAVHFALSGSIHGVGLRAEEERTTPARTLPWSPWQVRSYDAVVRYDSARVRGEFAVRLDLVNDGPVPADSAAVWLWPGFALDSVRSGEPA